MALADMMNAFATGVGISGADLLQYPNMVGMPTDYFRQPTPSSQNQIGLTAIDETSRERASKVLAGTESAVVSIPSFRKPMNRQTTSPIKVEAGTYGAFAGYQAANLSWSPIDLISTDTMARSENVGSGGIVQSMGQLHKGNEKMAGLLFGIGDIGNRMIPDAAQTFDNFAGGLLRKIGGRPTRYIDWTKGFDMKESLIQMKTSWIEMMVPWLQDSYDVVTQPWNRTAMGQGWSAFAMGQPVRIGATVPVTKGMLFATVS